MKIGNNVDIEFFDPQVDLPDDREMVLVIIKKDAVWKGTPQQMCICTMYRPRKSPPRFSDAEGYKCYTVDHVELWGKLKEK